MDTAQLLHPVRVRVVQRMLGGRQLTTAQLSQELPDVPTATLYRHIAALAGGGILRVVEQRQVRGGTERTYALNEPALRPPPREDAALTSEQHLAGITAVLAGVLGDAERYLDRTTEPGQHRSDQLGYQQLALWLTDDEFAGLVQAMNTVLGPLLANSPGPGRTRRLLTTLIIPGTDDG